MGNKRYIEYSEHIQSSAGHLQAMISDVLDAAQLEAGEVLLHESEFDLAAVFEEARTVIALRIDESNVDLEMDVPSDVRVYADISKLRQVLINLLTNAIAAADGGIIRLRGGVSGGAVFISVEDQGRRHDARRGRSRAVALRADHSSRPELARDRPWPAFVGGSGAPARRNDPAA